MVDLRKISATEYFKELVDEAIAHQRLTVSETANFYVVNLLASFLNRREGDDRSIALDFLNSFNASGQQRVENLVRVGDTSLFVTGFFPESLKRFGSDIGFYVKIGSEAYSILGERNSLLSYIYSELNVKFTRLVDVLNEVSEKTTCHTETEILRLYEKWISTGSKRTAGILAARGIAMNQLAKKPVVH